MEYNFAELMKVGVLMMAALANTSLSTGLDPERIETYGVGGLSMAAAALFYKLWRRQTEAREAEHKATVESLKSEVRRLREKYND